MITDIKNTIMEKYQVRKGKRRKTAFIEYIQGVCQENGIDCTVEKKNGNRNIVMGASPEDCEFIVGGHYDTCARMIIPNFITPRNGLIFFLYQLFVMVVLLVPGVVLGGIVGFFTEAPIGALVGSTMMLVMTVMMMAGPANKHTANDNTSGTIAVLDAMLAMTPEQRSRVCFVLFDNEEVGLLGSAEFASMHKEAKKNKPMVNLDCVSDGDYLFARLPSKAKKYEFCARFTTAMTASAEKHGMTPEIAAKGMYPSDQANFKQGIGVAALNRHRLIGLYMNRIHTKRDTVFNDRNIECLTEGLLALVSEEPQA